MAVRQPARNATDETERSFESGEDEEVVEVINDSTGIRDSIRDCSDCGWAVL